jgi:predicted nucleotidyltransferase
VATPESLSRLGSALRRTARELHDLGRQWALVGGLAVSARAEPRFTRDIDLVIGVVDDADAERLVHDLQARGYRVQAVVEQEATARLAAARLVPAGEEPAGVVVDALFASSGIEREVASEAETVEVVSGLRLPVATVGHLIALKVLARDDRTRPMDRADLVTLVGVATPADLQQARAAVALIERRGFDRGRDLRAELERLLADRPDMRT